MRKHIGMSLTFLALAVSLLQSPGQSVAKSGCRAATGQVVYDVPPRHPHPVSLVTVDETSTVPVIVINDDNVYYQSADFGNHWSRTDWPEGAVFSAPSNRNIIYGYVKNGIIQRSIDGGKNWTTHESTIDGVPSNQLAFKLSGGNDYIAEIDIVAVHPAKPLTVYATIRILPQRNHESTGLPSYFLEGMYVSEDGGDRWMKFSDKVGIFDRYPRRVVLGINPADTNLMFSEGERDILKSNDGGKTWNTVGESEILNQQPIERNDGDNGGSSARDSRPLNVKEFAFDPHAKDTVYMLSRKGIYQSFDAGRTWNLLDIGFDSLGTINSVAVDPSNPNILLAGSWAGLYLSKDRGCHFHQLITPSKSTANPEKTPR
jgi:photosystem II stability/assembly factor-like uncharacterized protein